MRTLSWRGKNQWSGSTRRGSRSRRGRTRTFGTHTSSRPSDTAHAPQINPAKQEAEKAKERIMFDVRQKANEAYAAARKLADQMQTGVDPAQAFQGLRAFAAAHDL